MRVTTRNNIYSKEQRTGEEAAHGGGSSGRPFL